MGINADTLDFLYESLSAAGITKLNDLWMMELGNQCIRDKAKAQYGIATGKSKAYFLGQRCHHHSIDWNGKDGAIPLDLCEPIPISRFIGAFDIITDFGDMEHVRGGGGGELDDWEPGEGHWKAWQNLHDMGKVGCVYVHTLPLVGAFKNHGSYHYTDDFFKSLIAANSYSPIALHDEQCDKRHHRRDYVFCSYVKSTDKPFAPNWDEFKGWLHR